MDAPVGQHVLLSLDGRNLEGLDVTTVRELIKMLKQHEPEMEVVIDDVVNGCLLAPRLRVLTPASPPAAGEVTLGSLAPPHLVSDSERPTSGALLIYAPSGDGDVTAGDGIDLEIREIGMYQSGDGFNE